MREKNKTDSINTEANVRGDSLGRCVIHIEVNELKTELNQELT